MTSIKYVRVKLVHTYEYAIHAPWMACEANTMPSHVQIAHAASTSVFVDDFAKPTPKGPGRLGEFDRDALVGLIPQMRAFARMLCRNRTQAEDLCQDALVRAWARRDSFTPGTNMRAWVLAILRNQFYSDLRRSWRSTSLDPSVAERTLVALNRPDGALELDEVRRAMLALPVEQREALILVAVAGLSQHDAAEICSCAEGTIKSRVSRARQSLLSILAEGDMAAEMQAPREAMASILADAERLRVSALN